MSAPRTNEGGESLLRRVAEWQARAKRVEMWRDQQNEMERGTEVCGECRMSPCYCDTEVE